MKQLENRVAVVTGAGSGIGRATSLALAEHGCRLAIADIDPQGLEETRRLLAEAAAQVTVHVVDVSDKARMQRFRDEVLAAHGGVQVLVNNAGVSVGATFENQTLEDFEWLMGINFWGVVYGTKFFLPSLLEADEAHIVNISSLFGLIGVPLQSSYCASKFAVRGLSESLRAELSSSRVGVTSVHPGGIATNIAATTRVRGDEAHRRRHQQVVEAFRRMLPPEKAAAAIVNGIKRNRASVLIARETFVLDFARRAFPDLTGVLFQWGYKRTHSL